jgi:hypothetical protein
MNKLLFGLAAFAVGGLLVGSPALSQPPGEKGDKGGPGGKGGFPSGPGGPGGKGGFPGGTGFKLGTVLPPFALDELNLTPEQQTKLAAIEADVKGRLDTLLTEEQKKRLESLRPPGGKGGFPGGPGGPGGDKGGPGGKGGFGGEKGGRGERPDRPPV